MGNRGVSHVHTAIALRRGASELIAYGGSSELIAYGGCGHSTIHPSAVRGSNVLVADHFMALPALQDELAKIGK